jgi:hypothetical protein
MTINGFSAENHYQLTWFDSWTGKSLGGITFNGTTVTTAVPSPGFTRDIIAIIKPEEEN